MGVKTEAETTVPSPSSGGRPKRKAMPSARAAAAMADGQPISSIHDTAVHREIVQNLVGLRDLEEEAKKDEEVVQGGIKGEPVISPPPEKKEKPASADGEAKSSRKSNGRQGKKNIPSEMVVVLKEWFDKHPDWPYPSQAQKEEFAKKTGMTEDRVNNWFINARKRNRDTKDKTSHAYKKQHKNWQLAQQTNPTDGTAPEAAAAAPGSSTAGISVVVAAPGVPVVASAVSAAVPIPAAVPAAISAVAPPPAASAVPVAVIATSSMVPGTAEGFRVDATAAPASPGRR